MSERREATDAELLEVVESLAGIGSWVWNTDTGSIRWSSQLYTITGVGEEFVPTVASFDALIHPDDLAGVIAIRQRMLEDASGPGHECRIVRPDGTIRVIILNARHLGEAPNRLVIGAVQDVTSTREVEERLRRQAVLAAVGRLAAGVAHDFNNLLSVIMANGSLLEMKLGSRLELTELMRASAAGRELTDRLLAVIDSQGDPEPTALDIDERLQTGTKLLEAILGPGIELLLELGSPPSIHADARRFDQLLVNLVLNASDAMTSGGILTLRTGTEDGGETVWLDVVDTGAGMSAEVLMRATEPFFSTKSHGVGSGQGLSMVQNSVDELGGKLRLTSTRGLGTTVRVTFCAISPGLQPAADAPALAVAGGSTILVVEDEEAVRRVVARVLTTFGYTVLEAAGPEDAGMFLAHDVDLVLCDVRMPDGGGEAVFRLFEGRGVPFLFMTGYTTQDAWMQGQVVIHKPFQLAELHRAVLERLDGAVEEIGGA